MAMFPKIFLSPLNNLFPSHAATALSFFRFVLNILPQIETELKESSHFLLRTLLKWLIVNQFLSKCPDITFFTALEKILEEA